MRTLTDYKNFWLVWLGCAGQEKGTTLYKVQQSWGITTNYLYHKEAQLKKPLFQAMIEQGFLRKEGRKVHATFTWISPYMIELNKIEHKGWSSGVLVLENWPLLQRFIEGNREILFSTENIQALYKHSLPLLNRAGHKIFTDLFLLTLTHNLTSISQKFRAGVVQRMLHTVLAVLPDRDLLGYFSRLQDLTFPLVIKDEKEMMEVLHPLV